MNIPEITIKTIKAEASKRVEQTKGWEAWTEGQKAEYLGNQSLFGEQPDLVRWFNLNADRFQIDKSKTLAFLCIIYDSLKVEMGDKLLEEMWDGERGTWSSQR